MSRQFIHRDDHIFTIWCGIDASITVESYGRQPSFVGLEYEAQPGNDNENLVVEFDTGFYMFVFSSRWVSR